MYMYNNMFLHLQGRSRKFQRGRGATQVCIYPSKKGTSGGGGGGWRPNNDLFSLKIYQPKEDCNPHNSSTL